MPQALYEEVHCKTALTRVQGMAFGWSLNPYRGCTHGCHYCFARSTHFYYDLDADDEFSSIIFVKTNIADVLRMELSSPRWQRPRVVIGTATDPYQPIEGKYRLTRAVLEAFLAFRTPVSIITKSSLVVRDVDLLAEIAQRLGCTVNFSITTLDRTLWRQLEPGTAPPLQRLRAMQRLAAAGVHAGVLLAPYHTGPNGDERQPRRRRARRRGTQCLLPGCERAQPGRRRQGTLLGVSQERVSLASRHVSPALSGPVCAGKIRRADL